MVVTVCALIFGVWVSLGFNRLVVIAIVLLVPTAVVISAVNHRQSGSPVGRTFRLLRSDELRENHRWTVLAAYLAPLLLSLLFWATQDSDKWAGTANGAPLQSRLCIGLWQACGPFAWVLLSLGPFDAWRVAMVFCATWMCYLMLVFTTKLQRLHYTDHLLLSCIWCFAGCPPSGLVIT